MCVAAIDNHRLETAPGTGIRHLRFEIRKGYGPIDNIYLLRIEAPQSEPSFLAAFSRKTYKDCWVDLISEFPNYQVMCEFVAEARDRLLFRGIELLKERSICRTGKSRSFYEDLILQLQLVSPFLKTT